MQENAVESKNEMCLKISVYAMVDAGDDILQWHAKLLWLKALFIFYKFFCRGYRQKIVLTTCFHNNFFVAYVYSWLLKITNLNVIL